MVKKKKSPDNSLEDINVFEVSLVSKPAIGRKYLLTKAAEGIALEVDGTEEEQEAVETVAGTPPANEGVNSMKEKLIELLKNAELSDEARDAITGAMETLISNKGAVSEDVMKSFYEIAGYAIPEKIVEKEVEKIVEVEVEKPTSAEGNEEVFKGMDDESRARFEAILKERDDKIEAAQKAADDAKKSADEERDLRVEKEFVQKAMKDYPHLPEVEKIGKVLKAIKEKLDEEDAEFVSGIFANAEKSIVEAKQFEQVGSGGAGANETTTGSGTDDKAQKLAAQMVEKGDFKSVDAAIAHLFDTQPKLFQ
jgi:hypothetical protein